MSHVRLSYVYLLKMTLETKQVSTVCVRCHCSTFATRSL